MSFRTYVDYNDDNVVKAIENVIVRENTNNFKEGTNMINKTIKKAALIYTFDKNGNRTTWEKTLRKVWFNWTTYETVDDDRMSDILSNLDVNDYDYLEV